MAEEVGFEPTELSFNGFQDRRLQPLGHPSANYQLGKRMFITTLGMCQGPRKAKKGEENQFLFNSRKDFHYYMIIDRSENPIFFWDIDQEF